VISSLDQVTADWLTGRLAAKGYLPAGRVIGVERERVFSHNAISAQLRLAYSDDAGKGQAPERLFVKIARPDAPWNEVEYSFYVVVAAAMRAGRPQAMWAFPRCYDAAHDPESRQAFLLLEDLSLTHEAADAPLPPAPEQAGMAVDSLAAIHAFWWEHQRLGQDIGRRHTAESLDEMIAWAAGNYGAWKAQMGDRLPAERAALLDSVFAGWPERRRERLIQGKGITLVHRDTHPLNFLYPRDGIDGGARIVDWQSWRVDTGTDDLAYMMACHWYPDYRARWERPLVARYQRALAENGVGDYSWDACWYDYRASVIRCLFFLLGSWHPQRAASMWWERLEKGLLAFTDLGCGELLAG
jgi:hypothetical protein